MNNCMLVTAFLCLTVIICIVITLIARFNILSMYNYVNINYLQEDEVKKILNQNKITYYKLLSDCKSKNFDIRGIENNNVINYYSRSIRNFNEWEKNDITFNIKKYLDKIKKRNSKIIKLLVTWTLVKVHNIESNFPHTHLDMIFIPSNIYVNKYFMKTLFHEKCHNLQREYPDQFKCLYTNYWPFYLAKNIINEPSVCDTRLNPDTENLKYIYIDNSDENNIKYYYMTTLINKNATHLSHVTNYFIEVEKKQDDPDTFILYYDRKIRMANHSYFNNISKLSNNNYHVNEISAEMFSIYVMELYNSKKTLDSFLYTRFKEWISDFLNDILFCM